MPTMPSPEYRVMMQTYLQMYVQAILECHKALALNSPSTTGSAGLTTIANVNRQLQLTNPQFRAEDCAMSMYNSPLTHSALSYFLPDYHLIVPQQPTPILAKKTRTCHRMTLVLDLDETLVHSSLQLPACYDHVVVLTRPSGPINVPVPPSFIARFT